MAVSSKQCIFKRNETEAPNNEYLTSRMRATAKFSLQMWKINYWVLLLIHCIYHGELMPPHRKSRLRLVVSLVFTSRKREREREKSLSGEKDQQFFHAMSSAIKRNFQVFVLRKQFPTAIYLQINILHKIQRLCPIGVNLLSFYAPLCICKLLMSGNKAIAAALKWAHAKVINMDTSVLWPTHVSKQLGHISGSICNFSFIRLFVMQFLRQTCPYCTHLWASGHQCSIIEQNHVTPSVFSSLFVATPEINVHVHCSLNF